jgi:hypothetical protein
VPTPTFRTFYHFLLDPDETGHEPWRRLDRTLLLDWAARLGPLMRALADLAPAKARHLHDDAVLEGRWALYALSQVNDLLFLPFQPPAPTVEGAAQPIAPISLDDYRTFWECLGLRPHIPRAFHPFFCEIVAVEPADDPEALAQICAVHWPALHFGDLLISRAGVTVSAGAQHIWADVAPRSVLHFTHRRHARPTSDLSLGWGSNSQWRTAFRRDYCDDGVLCYNVDGAIDVWVHSPERDLRFMGRDDASPRERYELLLNRCRILTSRVDGDAWLYGETATEPKLDDTTPWQMPAPSDRDEDGGRERRWLWFTEPQPDPPGAPPLLGKITAAHFFRLLGRLERQLDRRQWSWSSLGLVGERHGVLSFSVSSEVVLMAALFASPDEWLYLLRPDYHWKHLGQLATFPAAPIPDDALDAYIDARPQAHELLHCTVGTPEQLSENQFSLTLLSAETEQALLTPFGEPANGSDPEDMANQARLYPVVRELARADGDLAGEADATLRLGAICVAQGEVVAGMALLEEAQALASVWATGCASPGCSESEDLRMLRRATVSRR